MRSTRPRFAQVTAPLGNGDANRSCRSVPSALDMVVDVPGSSRKAAAARPLPACAPLSRRALIRRVGALATLGAGALLAPGLVGCTHDGANSGAGSQGQAAHTPGDPYTGSTFAFDTFCQFTVYDDEGAIAELGRLCNRYDKLFDLYDSASDIARVNAAGGAPVEVDPETAAVIQAGVEWSAQSAGRFDITIGAVSTLWDFDEGVRPADADIAAALPHVSWENVSVNGTTVQLADPAAKLDLGGIAKGYIADKLAEALRERGVESALLSLGGNILAVGSKPNGSAWTVGIRDPNEPGGTKVVDTVTVRGCSVVTSGLYERTFEQDGQRYWHILDPRTGYPVETDVVSDTLISPTSTAGDALSTTLFVAGIEAGCALADEHEGTAALFLDEANAETASTRWDELSAQ